MYFQLILKLTLADISWMYHQILSIEDRAKHCFKNECTLEASGFKNITIFQDDHIGIIKINMSLKQVVDRWAAFVQVRKFQKKIVVSSILPKIFLKTTDFP